MEVALAMAGLVEGGLRVDIAVRRFSSAFVINKYL
jgi:hypothetical protein